MALDDVSFAVAPGSFCVLLGLNGAGKSTLFSVITHLYAPRRGHRRIFGHDVARDSGAALARLGVVFQSRTLDADLSVEQNLAYHGALQGMTRAERLPRQKILLERVGLADRARDKARHLSGGQMRRIEIARALLHQPKLDPARRADRRARHQGARRHSRRSCAISRATTASACCGRRISSTKSSPRDHVVVLHKGKLRADATSAEIVAAAGRRGIGEAFAALTGARAPAEEIEA